MLSARALLAAVLWSALVACHHDDDPGFEIVRVPQSAYAAPDAGHGDGGPALEKDGGSGPLIVCIPQPSSDDESSTDCPETYQGRAYDDRVSTRHRNKGDDAACCYRRGRVAAHKDPDEDD